jgi:hypothetical protein
MFTNFLEMSFIVLNARVSPLDHVSGGRGKSLNIKCSLLVYGFKWITLYKILFSNLVNSETFLRLRCPAELRLRAVAAGPDKYLQDLCRQNYFSSGIAQRA